MGGKNMKIAKKISSNGINITLITDIYNFNQLALTDKAKNTLSRLSRMERAQIFDYCDDFCNSEKDIIELLENDFRITQIIEN